MAENLNYGQFIVTKASNNNIIEKYCYDGIESNCDIYGAIYNFDEAMGWDTDLLEGNQGICPNGWRVPSESDWGALEFSLGMNISEINERSSFRGTKGDLIKVQSACRSGVSCNSSGFSALMAGYGIDAYMEILKTGLMA